MAVISHFVLITCLLLCLTSFSFAERISDPGDSISIVIDDMGNNLSLGKRALSLPGNVSYSFLPDAPHTVHLAKLAHKRNKQVLLHLPMAGHLRHLEEENTLLTTMSESEFLESLRTHLLKVPFIIGVNNHMGSLLTPSRQQMDWIMTELKNRDLFFLDSRTTHLTVAASSASVLQVPFAERNVFLDNLKTEAAIRKEFARLIIMAKEQGQRKG